MKTGRIVLACCALISLVQFGNGALVRAAEDDAADAEKKAWTVSFGDAKSTAAAEKKDIFMEFTGSDWCPPCKAFHANVLSKEAFLTGAPKNFVLLKLDNPRDKSKQTEEEIEQYKKLSAEYEISGVPTVILADVTGRPYAKMVGYGGTEAEEYVTQLAEKQKIRVTRDEFLAKAEQAEGVEKAKLLDQAISGIDSELVLSEYKDIVDQIIVLDADNKGGVKEKYASKVQLAELQKRLDEITKDAGADAEGALKQIAELTDELNLEGEGLQQVLYTKAFILFRTDKAESKKTLEAALKLAPNSELGEKIDSILKRAFNDNE